MKTMKSSFFFFFMILAVSVFGVNSGGLNAEALNHLETVKGEKLTDKKAKKLVKVQNKIKSKLEKKELGLKGSLGIALAIIGLAVVLLSAVFSAPGIIGTLGVITLILGVVLEIWNLLDV